MGFGFVNLPAWHEQLRSLFQTFGHPEFLQFPVLDAEGFEPAWRSLELPDFLQAVDIGFHFPDKPLITDRFPHLITTDEVEAERRLFHPQLTVGLRGALGGTHPMLDIIGPDSLYPPVSRILACTDGVCSFIFSRMESENGTFEDCLREAQWRGIAPGNPMRHVHGIFFRSRLALLASLIFRCRIPSEQIALEEMNQVTSEDMLRAEEHGFAIRVLGVVEKTAGGYQGWVGPCLIPRRYFLAQVRGGLEAGYVQFPDQTSLLFSGAGTNRETQIRGLLADYHAAVQNRILLPLHAADSPMIPVEKQTSEFFLRFAMMDIAGSLSRICRIFEDSGVQIKHLNHRRIRRKERAKSSDGAEVVIFTQAVEHGILRSAVDEIRQEIKLVAIKSCLRCENSRP
jgi:homoserine dehydrogenase